MDEAGVWVDQVCQQIRCKTARESVAKELKGHIEDEKEALVKSGITEKEAIKQSVTAMGDPKMVGQQLDRTHRPRIAWSVVIIVCTLSLLGILIQVFLPVSGITQEVSGDYYIYKMLLVFPISIVALIFGYWIDYSFIGRYAVQILLITAVIHLLFISNTHSVNGQPYYSYYMSIIYLILLAGIIYKFSNRGYLGIVISICFFYGTLFICLITGAGVTILIQNWLGMFLLLLFCISKGWFHINRIKAVLLSITMMPLVSFLFLMQYEYRLQRFWAYINVPESYLGGIIQKTVEHSEFIGNARPFILDDLVINFAAGNQPNIDIYDYMITYYIGEYGYITAIIAGSCMLLLFATMIYIVLHIKNQLAAMIALACTMAIGGQMLAYLLTNLGISLLPKATLPFLGYGKTAMLLNMLMIGIFLSTYRYDHFIKEGNIFSYKYRLHFSIEKEKVE